jgi:hypothetical protein
MAFDQNPENLILEADLDPHGAVLLAAAFIAFLHDVPEWWSACLIPCEQTFREVAPFGAPDGDACDSGEAASWLLLFMREELSYS